MHYYLDGERREGGQRVIYWNDWDQEAEGTLLRANGNLVLIRDNGTGAEQWLTRLEIKEVVAA